MSAFTPDQVAHMIAVRRDLHQHPELSGQERRTAGVVATQLRTIGVDEVVEAVADTGVVGWVRGVCPGPVVLLRADIDALPLQEVDRGQPYRSRTPGVHHACGHDGHVAILLAVAEAIVGRRGELSGSVILMFQPAEERGGGARRMLEARPWPADLTPTHALALHLTTGLKTGRVDVRPGAVTASAQSLTVAFGSSGGHASSPHLAPDPVVCLAEFILGAQTVVSRSLDPLASAVLSFGVLRGGESRSVIPTRVEVEGTVRTYRNKDLELVRGRVTEIAIGVATAHGCSVEVDLAEDTYPAVVNNPQVAEIVAAASRTALSEDAVTSEMVIAGADDIGEVLLDFPGCFFFVGAANPERGITAYMHSPEFDLDEAALTIGADVLLAGVVALLAEAGPLPIHQ